jgi:hypothetical protein
MANTLEINAGGGNIQIDAQAGTLNVSYLAGDATAEVYYANNGGMPTTPLPQGESSFEVPDNSFQISYNIGDGSIKLSWEYV